MKKEPTIVLIGHSVLIDGIAVGLEHQRNLRISRIFDPGGDVEERLRSIMPELVIFELDEPGSSSLLNLLKSNTSITLLGLDRHCSQAVVLNSYQETTQNMSELIRIVQTIVHKGASQPKGGNLNRIDEEKPALV